MEGIAVHRGRGGETIITLMSDDNFNSLLQRNLLLQFTLLGNKAEMTRPAALKLIRQVSIRRLRPLRCAL